MPLRERNSALPIAALFVVQLIFGLNYAAAKVILADYPPVLWAAIRIGVAAVLMFGLSAFIVPKSRRTLSAVFLKRCFFYGLIGVALNQAFFLVGLKHTTSINSAILNTLTPLFTLVFAILAGNEKWTTKKGFGFLIAILGAVTIRDLSEFNMTSSTLYGDLFTLVGSALLGLFFTLSQGFMKQHSPFWVTAWMFLFSSFVLFLMSVSDWDQVIPATMGPNLLPAAVYNIVFATIVAYYLNSWTLTKVSSAVVALFIYFQPVIAVGGAWWTLGEQPSVRTFISMALIFAGVAMAIKKKEWI